MWRTFSWTLSFCYQLKRGVKTKVTQTICLYRGGKRTFVLSVPGHFPEQTEFLLPVKTPLRRILPERMSFELLVEVMMMMLANHYHNLELVYGGRLSISILGAVHPNSDQWIIGQVSIRPLTNHKNSFRQQDLKKYEIENVRNRVHKLGNIKIRPVNHPPIANLFFGTKSYIFLLTSRNSQKLWWKELNSKLPASSKLLWYTYDAVIDCAMWPKSCVDLFR